MGNKKFASQTQSTSTSINDLQNPSHSTTIPRSLNTNGILHSDYSVAFSEYQNLKSYENDGFLVHRLAVRRDLTRTWAKIRLNVSQLEGGTTYLHLVGTQIVRIGPGSVSFECPAPKAVCDSLERAHETEYVVNRVGGSIVFQKPIVAKISVSYSVIEAFSDIGIVEGAFFLDPQFREEFGWD